MAPNFNSGSVSPLTSYATAPSRLAHPLPAASPYTPVGPIGHPWASRQAAGRPPSGQSSCTACRVSVPPAAPTAAEQPSLNSTTATCHILKRTQVNPLCLSRNNPIACTWANRPITRRPSSLNPYGERTLARVHRGRWLSPLGHKGRLVNKLPRGKMWMLLLTLKP